MTYPAHFYQIKKSSESQYSRVPQGSLVVERLINELAPWKKYSAQSDQKPKTLILADWTAPDWSEEKLEATISKLSQLMDEGFVIYMWQEGRVRPLNKDSLANLKDQTVRKAMTPVSSDLLFESIAVQNLKLIPDNTCILDNYELNGLIQKNEGANRPRCLDVQDVLNPALDLSRLLSILKNSKPPITKITQSEHSVAAQLRLERLKKYFPLIPIEPQYRKIVSRPKEVLNITHFDLEQLKDIEELSLDEPNMTLGELQELLIKLPKLRHLTLSYSHKLFEAITAQSFQLAALAHLTIIGEQPTTAQLQQFIGQAPLKILELDKGDGLRLQPKFQRETKCFDESATLSIPTLEYLKLTSLTVSSLSTLNHLLVTAPKLKKIQLSPPITQEISVNIEELPSLEECNVGILREITLAGIKKLLYSPAIKVINLRAIAEALVSLQAKDIPLFSSVEQLVISTTARKPRVAPPLEVSGATLGKLLAQTPLLKVLMLSNCSNLADLNMEALPLRALESLIIKYSNIPEKALLDLVLHSPKLEYLHLLHSNAFSSAGLSAIFSNMPQIRKLTLENKPLKFINEKPFHFPSLEQLYCSGIIFLSDLHLLLADAPLLRDLSICDSSVFQESIDDTIQLPFLENFHLSSPFKSTELEKFLNNAPHLKKLELISSKSEGFFTTNLQLPALNELTLVGAQITEKNLHTLLANTPNLRVLTLSLDNELTLEENEFYLPSLENFFALNGDISFKGLHKLLAHAINLKVLDLSSCQYLDRCENESFNLPELELLNLEISNISENGFLALIAGAPNLKEVRLPSVSSWSLKTRQKLLELPLDSRSKMALEYGYESSTSDAGTQDPRHSPSANRHNKPTPDDFNFQFKGKNKTLNQGMIIEKLSQYLILTNQHKAFIPKIQDGICNNLSHYFLTFDSSSWNALVQRIKNWDGNRVTLDKDKTLIADFEQLFRSVQGYQFGSSTSAYYIGNNLSSFLEHQRCPMILMNPWHAIALNYSPSNSMWTVYDPNYVGEPKTATSSAELQHLIKNALGELVFVEEIAATPLISDVNVFLRDGGLLALVLAKNKSQMLAQLTPIATYSKEALEGLLLRDTEGTPAWVRGMRHSLTSGYTANLLEQFKKSNPDFLEQLQHSMAALSPYQRHEIISTLIPTAEIPSETPAVPSDKLALLQQLRTGLRSITHHEYRRELETWRKPSAQSIPLLEYCQKLVTKKPNKKQLITLDSNSNTTALSLALLKHCHSVSRPVYWINSPDDLVCSASWVERQEERSGDSGEASKIVSGRVRKGPGGPLYDFLKKNTGQAPVLIVNYDRFKADDIVRFNSLLDEKREVDKVPLSEDVVVLGLMNPHAAEAYQGSDFYSRFDGMETCPLDEALLKAQIPDLPKEIPIEDPESDYVINLGRSPDWEERLLGRWLIKEDQLIFEKGELEKAFTSKKPICIQNAPWKEPRFLQIWQQAMVFRTITHAGQTITIPEGMVWRRKDGYDWKKLASQVLFEDTPRDKAPLIVNPKLLRDLFCRYHCNDTSNTLNTLPGLIQEHQNQTLTMYLTQTLSADEWGMLLTTCLTHQVILSCQLAPGVTLPKDLASLVKVQERPLIPPIPGPPLATKHPLVMTSTDVAATIALVTHTDNDWISIDVSECDAGALIQTLNGTFDANALRFKFKKELGALSQALAANKKILLHGQFSDELMDSLAPLLLKPLDKGRLVLVSNSAKPFNYCSVTHDDISSTQREHLLKTVCHASPKELEALPQNEPLSFNHLRAHLAYHRAFPSQNDSPWQGMKEAAPISVDVFDAAKSEEKANAFLNKRLSDVMAVLAKAPYAYLTGPTAVGKSTFVEKQLATQKGVILYQGESRISDWANDAREGSKILFIDEANITSRQWSELEGLFHNPPGVMIHNTYHPLSAQHKVVFAGNPLSYGGERQEAPLFARHGNAIAFTPLSLEVIYERMLKPVFQDTPLAPSALELVQPILNVYRFLIKQTQAEVLISPRELQMMALMMVSYAKQHPTATKEDHLLAAQHYAYRLAAHLNRPTHRAEFETLFKPVAALPHEAFPEQKTKFLVTDSRQAIMQQLDDLLVLREYRAQATKEVHQYGGLGGLILDGEPGIGKSELVIAALRARGYKEAHTLVPEKPFYRMAVSMQYEDKKDLLLKAFDEGAVVIIDEINSSPMMERLLNSLLMGRTLEGTLPKKPGFLIIGTQNPVTMAGRLAPSTALARRLITTPLPPYTSAEMHHILIAEGLEASQAHAMVEEYQFNCSKAARELLHPAPTFRDLLRLAKRVIASQGTKTGLDEKIAERSPVITEEPLIPAPITPVPAPITPTPAPVTPAPEPKDLKPKVRPVTRREKIHLLNTAIEELRLYGEHLIKDADEQTRNEGHKAITVANTLKIIATQFIAPQMSTEGKEQCKTQFTQELEQGYKHLSTHRAAWKPILANIAIAATGIGLLILIGKLLLTQTAFFTETKRQQKTNDVKNAFEHLDKPDEEQETSPPL